MFVKSCVRCQRITVVQIGSSQDLENCERLVWNAGHCTYLSSFPIEWLSAVYVVNMSQYIH